MRSALAFLTVFGRSAPPNPKTLRWFPAIGLLLGAALGGVWWAAGEVWSGLLAAALVVLADAALTGALHLDGLADTADGLLPHADRQRRLAIMAAPDVGAFGVTALVVVLLVRTAALASQPAEPLLLAGVWCASRTVMATAAGVLPYARPGGLVDAFRGASTWPIALGGAVVAGVAMLVAVGARGLAALVTVAAVAAAVGALARRRVGGITGDVLGAIGVLGETAALVVVAT